MTTYYTSDTHFGHANIIRLCNRPYDDVVEMNEDMVRIWNEVVDEDDTVYHLGDFSMGSKNKAIRYLGRLKGRKILIAGNHDPARIRESSHWHSVHDYLRVADVCLLHYPMAEWNNMDTQQTIHLHGHTHGKCRTYMPNRFDVGWDVFGKPVTLQEILDV